MSTEVTVTNKSFENSAGKGVSLIDFWAPWCGPCRMQGPIIEQLAEKMAGKATIGKCNVDEETELAAKFSVRSIPTLILFKDGKEVERFVGVQNEQTLLTKLETLIAG